MSETTTTTSENVSNGNGRRLLPFTFAIRNGVLITGEEVGAGEQMPVYCMTMPELRTVAEVRRYTGCPSKFIKVKEHDFNELLQKAYERDSTETRQMVQDIDDSINLASLAENIPKTEDLLEQEGDAPVIRLINALLTEAIRELASDIHIETFPESVVVRFRIDGVLREIVRLQPSLSPLLVSRIKVMARLDIAEKRVPQDGRTSLRIAGRELDVRVSVMPTASGERVVLRLLDKEASRLQLTALGMNDTDINRIRDVIASPHGIFLVTGPTGEGKTTTLYASLSEINTESVNILTVEDPIEYNLQGIGQTQVNTRTGMTFARGLRAMLRQDPNIVMVGEIRDLETAQIAIQASLTGHLVLSTLHTNTAVGTVVRLVDMGVAPYLLATSLIGVLSQRLVRVLCKSCRYEREPQKYELDFMQNGSSSFYSASGCEICGNTGYRGRTGIYEVLLLDDEIKQSVHDRVSEQELAQLAHKRFPTIQEDGKAKVQAGITTVEEVMRVTLSE
ncbi:MAG: type II secretion system protein GspE [Gammaproteobacteria bacterium]|nr:type II secretion system protein GspE [Gammaproteobacteria bacterium]MYD81337.1 type II secretion system protein GspE [Gammaproteobacteria bacterium]